LWALALICAFASDCTQGRPPAPPDATAPDLRVPHLSKVPGFAAIEVGVGAEDIASLTTYMSPGQPGIARVLFGFGYGYRLRYSPLYDLRHDNDTESRRLALPALCVSAVQVSPDGAWAAARLYDGDVGCGTEPTNSHGTCAR
jgi:hypothetical protein